MAIQGTNDLKTGSHNFFNINSHFSRSCIYHMQDWGDEAGSWRVVDMMDYAWSLTIGKKKRIQNGNRETTRKEGEGDKKLLNSINRENDGGEH